MVDSLRYSIEVIKRQPDGAWRIEKYLPADGGVQLISINFLPSFADVYFKVRLPRPE